MNTLPSKIYFVTTNPTKFQEVSEYFKELCPEITIEQVALEVPEIQSLDVIEIARHKAHYAWQILQAPLMVDDGGIYLKQYHNFPGPLAKWVYKGIGLEGFWRLAQNDPRVFFLCLVVYMDGPDNFKIAEGVLEGTIIEPKGVPADLHMPYTAVFIPEGFNKPFAEVKKTPEGKMINHRYKVVRNLIQQLKD